MIVLHELAHCLTPDVHGVHFAAEYLALVKRFIGFGAWRDLRLNMEMAGVEFRRCQGAKSSYYLWRCEANDAAFR